VGGKERHYGKMHVTEERRGGEGGEMARDSGKRFIVASVSFEFTFIDLQFHLAVMVRYLPIISYSVSALSSSGP
jgi:hypothetical protein